MKLCLLATIVIAVTYGSMLYNQINLALMPLMNVMGK